MTIGSLQPTWLYWLLLAFIIIETVVFNRKLIVFHFQRWKKNPQAIKSWVWAPPKRKRANRIMLLRLVISVLLLIALVLQSPSAFFVALALLLPVLLNFMNEIGRAKGGEQIGAAVGGAVGGAVQVFVIIWIISTIDPTSTFSYRWEAHLAETDAS